MTANRRGMPRCSISLRWARTMSRMVTDGKSVPQTPPPGLGLRGPVLPMQPPSTLAQMTKKRSVSTGRPGPTTRSHQPGLPVMRVGLGDVLVAGEGVADQDGVAAVGVELAVRAVCHLEFGQHGAALEREPVREGGGLVGDRPPGLGDIHCRLHIGSGDRGGNGWAERTTAHGSAPYNGAPMSSPRRNPAAALRPAPRTGFHALRAELDRIDDELHDGLMRRAEIVPEIGALGAKGGVPLRPGREASIIRRLLARNRPPLQPATVVRIWRELLAGSTAQQRAMLVAVGSAALRAGGARAFWGADAGCGAGRGGSGARRGAPGRSDGGGGADAGRGRAMVGLADED